MRLGFFLREATRSLRRSAVPSFAAMATVLVTMLVLGVFIPVVQATTGAANDIRGKLLLDVYLKPGASSADNSSAAPTAGSASGSEMRRSVRQLPAPVMVEASSSRGSIAWNAAERRR